MAIVAVAALAAGGFALSRFDRWTRPVRVTIATGGNRGLRARLIESLKTDPNAYRVQFLGAMVPGQAAMLRQVETGQVQFAMIQDGFDLSRHADLRQAASLHVEALHLLVKEEFFDEVSRGLHALKGRRVQTGGNVNAVGHRLAVEILSLAGLASGDHSGGADYVNDMKVDLVEETRRDRLPDAVFLVSALPSSTVRHLITHQRYRLVPMPFARAFGLGALADLAKGAVVEDPYPLLKGRIVTAMIPAYTYGLAPPVPPADIPTLGLRILLVTHRAVKSDTVERVLDAIADNPLARAFQPSLSTSLTEGPPQLPWHDGTTRFMERDKPVLTSAMVSNLANSIQIVGPALGALLCLWQWYRLRRLGTRQNTFEALTLEVSRIESEAMELELADGPDLQEPLRLRQELGRLKAEALRGFCRGELVGNDHMANFLIQVNDARSSLSALILRRRDARGPATPPDPSDDL